MASPKSICHMLNAHPVEAVRRPRSSTKHLPNDDGHDNDVMSSGVMGFKGQCNNLALGNLDFKCVPTQLFASDTSHGLRFGDVCVRLVPVISQSEEYSLLVDLYNTYVTKGSAMIARACINSYAGTEELCIPAIPIHVFVSEWNKTLQQFQSLIRRDNIGVGYNAMRQKPRLTVVSNVIEITLKNVPILSDHLWFVLHSIVSKPSMVKQVLQLIGSIASISGSMCHTGEVENVAMGKVGMHAVKLYLIAKSVPNTGNNVTVLGDESGATLGLIWVAQEEELYDQLRDDQDCYYLCIGTETGNTFRCDGFCEWRYYNNSIFNRMTTIGHATVSRFKDTMLAGDTGDSARLMTKGP